MAELGGILLCGGMSRRMGRPKAWLPFGPEVLLQRVARLLGQQVGPIVVVAAPGQDVPPLPDSISLVRDAVADLGPLQGLATGLAALPDGIDLAYATATDAPSLRPGWVGALAGLIDGHDLAIPEDGGHLHPLAALYRRRVALPAVEGLLGEGRHRPALLVERLRSVRVDAGMLAVVDPGLETLRNLNTPEDYRRALVDAGFDPGGHGPGWPFGSSA